MGVNSSSYAPYHDSTGKQSNPTTSTDLANTGAMVAGLYEVRVFVGCSVAAYMTVQVRNAGDTANVYDETLIRCAAGQTGEYVLKVNIETNQFIRVRPSGGTITGDAEATIQAFRVV